MRRSSHMRLRWATGRSWACEGVRHKSLPVRGSRSVVSVAMVAMPRRVTPSTSVSGLYEVWQGQRPLPLESMPVQLPTGHWSSLVQERSAGTRQTGVARTATACFRPSSGWAGSSTSAKNCGITARGWQALGRTGLGSGAGVPSAPQSSSLPPFLQSRQPYEATAATAMHEPRSRSMRGLYRQVLPAEIGQVSPRAKHGIWRRSMADPEKPMLGAWSAIGAFAALYVGQHSIGIGAQYHSIVSGLWVTEALAIAAPAIFVLLLAGVRPAPYLGFRALTWKHALV